MFKFYLPLILLLSKITLYMLNLPFNYPYINLGEKLITSYIIFDVNLSASTYYKLTLLYFIFQSCNLPQYSLMIRLQKCVPDFL